RSLNTAIVGKSAKHIAELAGISAPDDTRALVGKIDGVGRDYPLSIEKLSPILAFYVVDGWQQGCERCNEILRFGGTGHTLAVHANDAKVIQEFGLHKLAFRIVINTPAAHGSIGYTTNLVPSMTLGCGTWGGNITTDNISPLHLINVKRVAYETHPIHQVEPAAPPASVLESGDPSWTGASHVSGTTPGREVVRQAVEEFLKSKVAETHRFPSAAHPPAVEAQTAKPVPVPFVCEDDVRRATGRHEKIPVNSRTIITPAARDLGEEKQVFNWV
ncbi:MAG: hypothetical protein HYX74_00495, partial [Acidobacteria bacterium]|nr:hypothetical protein [Acidobacteriota bacterium]